MQYRMMASPLGDLLLAGEGEVLELIGFPEGKGEIRPGQNWVLEQNMLRNAVCQLNEYFEGRRKDFTLNLKPSGTPFQLSVLAALEQIPYGQTRTYAEIARQIGRPKAVRAVGAANGRNPLPIVIPCHRVIGSDGSLTGFGGGIAAKQYLLSLETAELQLC